MNTIENFVSELNGENKIVVFGPHKYTIEIVYNKGMFISFLNSEGKECIGLDYNDNVLYLGNYYFNTTNCIRIPNDWFFNEFLKPLAKLLKVERIVLHDSSTKQFTSCNVPMIFFALAGKQTFYNRYGFVNKRFDRYIEKLKTKTLRDIEVTNSLVLAKGKHLPISLMKRLIKSTYLDKPIPEIANFVLDTCKNEVKSNKYDVSIVNDIIKYFKIKIIIDNEFEYVLKSRTKSI